MNHGPTVCIPLLGHRDQVFCSCTFGVRVYLCNPQLNVPCACETWSSSVLTCSHSGASIPRGKSDHAQNASVPLKQVPRAGVDTYT